MKPVPVEPGRIRAAWQGRISGCLLGKPLEVLSFKEGLAGLKRYLEAADALPLRDYVPLIEGSMVDRLARRCCRGHITRFAPDDDINYTVLALLLLEQRGPAFDRTDVARAWLKLLPAGETWTAERVAYRTILNEMADEFVNGEPPGFDLDLCSDHEYNDWIGAQIRADLYGWVCPGLPEMAAELAARDASLSHRHDGVYGAVFVAALGAAIPAASTLDVAIDIALTYIPVDCDAAAAVRYGRSLTTEANPIEQLHQHYADVAPVHTVNNLAVVVWALCSSDGDFGAAIGNAVSAGWDTDCNGATVGALSALSGASIDDSWTRPWDGRVGVSLAGHDELELDDLVERTVAVAEGIAGGHRAIH